jgi:polyisoprenyl-phosphate glycosyltransferase
MEYFASSEFVKIRLNQIYYFYIGFSQITQTDQMQNYSIVIPVYKSSQSLEIIVSEVNELQNKLGCTFEIIFVNDSPFQLETSQTLQRIGKNNLNTKILTLRKNQGQHLAILVGLTHAKGKYIITMDDDLQHPVKEIPKLIAAMDENPTIEAIFALSDYKNKKHRLWRNVSSFLLNKIDTFFLKKPKGIMKSAFRIMTFELAQALTTNYNAMPSIPSLIVYTTHNIMNIEVEHMPRQFGKSNYSLSKLISLALNNLIHYSSLPLKIMGIIGFLGFFFSVFFIAIILVKKLFFNINFPGYASTVTLISFFGGLNLFAVGIIGEYLIRIIKEQQKPGLESLIKKPNP